MLKPILLVEDNPDDLELALRALTKTNLANEVVTVRDGEQALHYLKREGDYANRPSGNPAVVLLDLKLPKIDGIQVLEYIKSDENLKSIPVVMLTSSKMESDLTRAYKLNVNAYVVKPINFSEFIEAVRELGMFWAVLNEPPPGSHKSSVRPKSAIATPSPIISPA
ncbi:response regulator [Rariglobus hedericola]|uniref:Response regulator n=1 Tax=Rariglobus hedericola TaxID=2597822 RepID=A0A556QMN5_9BACT|nr:response regulator [Rariglobus hedericola]TSJ77895.1 response regulator [Rariglobus hedericola]